MTAIADDARSFSAALEGQYDIEREIGRGGMGIVYVARDLKLHRRVAIKTLPPHLAGDHTVRERFLREARMSAALSHPNIVQIHRADEIAGHVFFVMGYVDGESLAQRIQREGFLPPLAAARILCDVASALGYAHSRGVIHRDVKAENILLELRVDHAMVTDFGIARLAEAGPLTSTGQVLGTVYYLSPEQISGERVDARSDLYSLGVVGYYALTGRFPFDAELASAVLVAHVTKQAPNLSAIAPHLPRALTNIVQRCLAKNPDSRFASSADVVAALTAAIPEIERGGAVLRPSVPLLSSTEAHAVWKRAAELQADTGIHTRPAAIPGPRDNERDLTRTSGFKPLDVREAALEAGIDQQYVDHALVEHGVIGSARAPHVVPAVINDITDRPVAFVGAPTDIHLEIIVEGEMPDTEYDVLIDIIQRKVGDVGSAASVGRGFSWTSQSRQGRQIQVSILPRHGKTTIRLSESLRNTSGGIFAGIMAGVGGAGGAMVFAATIGATHNPVAAMAFWVATIATSYLGSRWIYGAVRKSRERSLRSMADALAKQARELIDGGN
jgi:serine/threonine protein kinase